MNKRISLLATLAIAACLASVSLAQDNTRYTELPNFHQVNDQVYRGAQPKEGGLQKLKQLGIKTIINLRDDDGRARAEETEAQAAGIRYFNIPMGNFGAPADKTVDQVLALLSATENQPVFVHCKRGSDRTGTIIAIYRIEHDGWTSEKAKAEAKRYGIGFWQTGMKNYIHDYYSRRAQNTAEAPARPPL
jgi:tyrosine-protein phosphatase SIW14